jgi:hypothetical protein
MIWLCGLLIGAGSTFLLTGGAGPAGADCPGDPGTPCGNGDVNGSGTIDIADAVYLLQHLFANGPEIVSIETPCLSVGSCPIEGRFVHNQDGTVTDNCTGLMWQQAIAHHEYAWAEALHYCENLELAGHDDWRLPSVKELQSIVDYGRWMPSMDPVFSGESEAHWSSTPYAKDLEAAWYVNFYHGAAQTADKLHPYVDVRAVRTIQPGE